MKKMNDSVKRNINMSYEVVEDKKIFDTLLAEKMILAADVNVMPPFVMVTAQNAFLYNAKSNTIEVFTGSSIGQDNKRKKLIINREIHLPDNKNLKDALMKEYIEKFICRSYDFCYLPSKGEIVDVQYPAISIPHIILEQAREWLYT